MGGPPRGLPLPKTKRYAKRGTAKPFGIILIFPRPPVSGEPWVPPLPRAPFGAVVGVAGELQRGFPHLRLDLRRVVPVLVGRYQGERAVALLFGDPGVRGAVHEERGEVVQAVRRRGLVVVGLFRFVVAGHVLSSRQAFVGPMSLGAAFPRLAGASSVR